MHKACSVLFILIAFQVSQEVKLCSRITGIWGVLHATRKQIILEDTKQIRAKWTQIVIELRSLSHKCKSEWGKGMSMPGGNCIMADLAGRSLPSSNFNNWNLSSRSHRVCTETRRGLQSGIQLDLGMTRQVKQAFIISGTRKKKNEAWVIPLSPPAQMVCSENMPD